VVVLKLATVPTTISTMSVPHAQCSPRHSQPQVRTRQWKGVEGTLGDASCSDTTFPPCLERCCE
jgi:hypothetical protein